MANEENDEKPKAEAGEEKPVREKKVKAPKGEKAAAASGLKTDAKAKAKGEKNPRLEGIYRETVAPALMKEFGLKNKMQVPRLQKIVVNMGLGEATQNQKIIETAVEELQVITGQKPVVTRSKKSIASFKLRENQPIGAMVTLRRARMWEFADRLINLALPRVRDFKGVSSKAFDGRGNYTLGIREQIIFPEMTDQVEKYKGMNITFVTTAPTDEQGRALLRELGMPFRK